jgi:hypothetical protein
MGRLNISTRRLTNGIHAEQMALHPKKLQCPVEVSSVHGQTQFKSLVPHFMCMHLELDLEMCVCTLSVANVTYISQTVQLGAEAHDQQ